ncbi:MAG: ester cyclase [Thaumarchaeota archaeon]|nr:ester cyclase [Nitrososphaerota archaeon]
MQDMTSGERPIDVARNWAEKQNSHDLPGLISLISDAVEVYGPGMPGRLGKAQFEEYLRQFDRGFPDMHEEIISYVESGDTIACEVRYSGTNTGSMVSSMGGEIPPTGKKMSLPGSFFMRVKDGKIISFHGYFDQATMAQQLGMSSQPR